MMMRKSLLPENNLRRKLFIEHIFFLLLFNKDPCYLKKIVIHTLLSSVIFVLNIILFNLVFGGIASTGRSQANVSLIVESKTN